MKLDSSVVRKVFLDTISSHFTLLGFKGYLTGGDPGFVLDQDKLVIHFFFNFFRGGDIGTSPIGLSHYEVENFILMIGMPKVDMEVYKKRKRSHLSTVAFREMGSVMKRPENEQDVVDNAQAYIDFYETKGSEWIAHYSYLPNILKEMDRLRSEGLFWHELLSGGPENLVRGLIISKLCADKGFSEKLEFVDENLAGIDDWTPYWEKYKEVLSGIEPKYNL